MLKMQESAFEPSVFTGAGTVEIDGKEIPYQVISEDNVLTDETGKPVGSVFTYSYFRKDLTEAEVKERPVLFAFNGGPGSSSIWLHWGLLSPKKIDFENPVDPEQNGPYRLENNDRCLLDVCDIVLIDPVDCGFGQLLDPAAGGQFFGVDQDANSIALVIEKWLLRYGRMNAPKYIMGESYGTLRASLLPNFLMGGPTFPNMACTSIAIDGIILMGCALDVDVAMNPNPMLQKTMEPSVLHLPTIAAVRYYHQPEDGLSLSEFVENAQDFAADTYLRALYMGNRLAKEELADCISKLAYFTGMPENWFRTNGLRLTAAAFPKAYGEVFGKIVGTYDGRYTMPLYHDLKMPDPVADDGAMGKYTAYYSGIMNGIGKDLLGITRERPYKAINFAVNGAWNYQGMRTAMEALQEALRRNPNFKVLVANGMFDLCTTMGEAKYNFSQLHYEEGQVIIKDYPSGHMAYIGDESYAMLAEDLHTFIQK